MLENFRVNVLKTEMWDFLHPINAWPDQKNRYPVLDYPVSDIPYN